MRGTKAMRSLIAHPRKRLKKNFFRKCLLRSLLVLLVNTLLIVLCLLYADVSNLFYPVPSVLSRDEVQDMFVRSAGPRAVIFVMSNKIDAAVCYLVGSAYLSGLPVVVAGYRMPFHTYLSKFNFMKKAIENAGLEPEDVIMALDSDMIFTGVDLHPFLERFIAQSAATPGKLDALAVRQGRAMAPYRFSGEGGCWAPLVFYDWRDCEPGYEAIHVKMRNYTAAHPEHKLALPFDLGPQRYLNSGTTIARVWAYKEYLQKSINLTKTRARVDHRKKGWDCDQSVFTALYLDLLSWEVEQDVFSKPLRARQAARSPYGVRAGLIDLDYANNLTSTCTKYLLYQYELHNEHWSKYLSLSEPEDPHSQEFYDLHGAGQFVTDLYKRAYAAHGEEIYTELAVPRWVAGRKASEGGNITLTPPLLGPKLRPIDTVDGKVRRTYPVIYHAAGYDLNETKVMQLENAAIAARWFVPMVHSRQAKKQAMEYLASVPLFLSRQNSIVRGSYHAQCGFPFEATIEKVKSLSNHLTAINASG